MEPTRSRLRTMIKPTELLIAVRTRTPDGVMHSRHFYLDIETIDSTSDPRNHIWNLYNELKKELSEDVNRNENEETY